MVDSTVPKKIPQQLEETGQHAGENAQPEENGVF